MSPLFLALLLAPKQTGAVYLDPSKPPKTRAQDLVGRMTLEEKIGQMMNEAPAIPRLGVKKYNWWSEALHGLARNNVTVFPQAIGNAATFDPELVHQMATYISDEARAQFNQARPAHPDQDLGLDFWTPNINIFRDPRWGRGQETYGEDPFLTGRMAVAFITGMQGNDPKHLKAIATPKHFAVHSGPDPMRHQFDAKVDLREIWMTYLPQFESALTEGGAWSTMSSYNRLNGLPNSANPWLLEETLRKRWGFPGYVVSDCGAIDDILYGHKFVKTREEAAAIAVKAGCDLECGNMYRALKAAVTQKLIPEKEIDKAVERLMEARIRLGCFDATGPYSDLGPEIVNNPLHRQVARKLADESIVLLKNESNTLPLKKDLKTIAVIGPNATSHQALYGNYNGSNPNMVTPLKGIQDAVGPNTRVLYARGCSISGLSNLQPLVLDGLTRQVFNNPDLAGQAPVTSSPENTIMVDSESGQLSPHPYDARYTQDYSVRWTGHFRAGASGIYTIAMTCDDGMRVFIDGKKVLEDWRVGPARTTSIEMELVQGQDHAVTVEFFQRAGQAVAKLEWTPPVTTPYQDAMEAAEQADAIVVVAGIDGNTENEERDRQSIELPTVQQNMIKALASLNKPIVLVYENGGPITFGWAKEHIPAILEAWYPGEEGGNAIADVLFGKVSPSGRLPVTVFKSLDDLPAFEDYRNAGHTYRFSTKEPEWPFGYGLSYAKFRVTNVTAPATLELGQPLEVTARVTNSSPIEADDVVELYLKHGKPSLPMPLHELKAVARVHLRPGQTQEVHLTVPLRELAVLRADTSYWLEPEPLEVFVGDSQPGPEAKYKAVDQRGRAHRLPFPKSTMRD
jgi:beta-glucosidase